MTGENAFLLSINSPGALDRAGDAVGDGPALWEGRAPAHLKRTRKRVLADGAMTLVEIDVLVILRSRGVPVIEQPGDQARATTVTVEDRRTATPATATFRVIAVENRAGGIRADSVRLELAEVT